MKFKFNVDIYSYKVIFATTASELGVDNEYEFACFTSGDVISILCTDLWGDYKSTGFLRCLSHECNHAAMRMLDGVGVKFDADNQEALCYLQDYIFSRILTKLS